MNDLLNKIRAFGKEKPKKLILIIIAICLFYGTILNSLFGVSDKEENIPIENVNGYVQTSMPIGITDLKVSMGYINGSNSASYTELSAIVKKNNDDPKTGKITIRFRFFDDQKNLIDEQAYTLEKFMHEGDTQYLSQKFFDERIGIHSFKINDKRVAAIQLVEISEKDATEEEQKQQEEKEKKRAEQVAQEQAKIEAAAKAEQEAKSKAEAEAKAKAEQETKEKAEAEAAAKAEQEAKAEAAAKAKAEKEAKEKATQAAKTAEQLEEEYVNSCISVTSEELQTKPSSYKGKKVAIEGCITSQVTLRKGKIDSFLEGIGVYESDDTEEIMIDEEIAVLYSPSELKGRRFLNDYFVFVYGEFMGLTEITSTNAYGTEFTRKIPQIRAKYIYD